MVIMTIAVLILPKTPSAEAGEMKNSSIMYIEIRHRKVIALQIPVQPLLYSSRSVA